MLAVALLVLAVAPGGAAGQDGRAASRLDMLDLERIELPGVTVVYSSRGPVDMEKEARRQGRYVSEAIDFFADSLGGGLSVRVAVLAPADFGRVSQSTMPFSLAAQRTLVVPVRPAGPRLMGRGQGGQDDRLFDLIRLHELSHAVAAYYLYPSGFRRERPPVRWFDELVASYLAHAYMRAAFPELAEFAETMARDMMDYGAPHFTSLEAYDRHYDEYSSTSKGATTLNWFHNAFNRRAAELYDDEGLDFFRAIRRKLPWVRYELWTSESLLAELEDITPGFYAWADDMERMAPRR